MGACLLQGEKGEEHPVVYASRLLTPAERNYSTTEREALAVVWAVNKFRGYIEGARTRIASDHQPLRWLMSLRTPTGRLARWALLLQPFNLDIQYVPGKSNVIADMLSRIQPEDDRSEDSGQTDQFIDVCSCSIDLPHRSAAETRSEQLKDPELRSIIEAFEGNTAEEQFMRYTRRGYIMSGGVLYRFVPELGHEDPQLLVPEHERKSILEQYHDAPTAGHYGADRTTNRIAEHYFWTGMGRQVADYVRGCIDCQRYKATNQKPAGLVQTPVMQQRFEVVCLDLFGPLVSSPEGYRHVLIVEDSASRWVELFALKSATAEECATTLLNEVLLRFGVCRRLTSDNGPQFVSAVIQQLSHVLGFKQNLIPVYHPQANMVERKNRDLKTQLAILVGNNHASWPGKLPGIRFAMNSARCSSTGHSAAYLTFSRELRTPDGAKRDLRAVIEEENFLSEILPRLRDLSDTLRQAKEIHEMSQDQRKIFFDRHRRPTLEFQPGDSVLVVSHVQSNAAKGFMAKLAPRRDGPYRIAKKVGAASYAVTIPSQGEGTTVLYHASALEPYFGDSPTLPTPVCPIRRRGRPKKTTNLQEPADAVSTPVRKRGRPRKETKLATENAGTSLETSPIRTRAGTRRSQEAANE